MSEGEDLNFDEGSSIENEDEKVSRLKKIKELFQNKLVLIISLVFLVIFIIGIVLVVFKKSDESTSQSPTGMSTIQSSDKKERKKKKAKKKKIKYVVLFKNLDSIDATQVLRELSFEDILFTTEQNGKKYSIFVDQEKENEARNLLAIKGIPGGNLKGYQLLDNAQTLGVTEFDKRIRFIRALSGEIERAILRMKYIEDAKVHIVLPEQRLFSVTQPPVTASVLIQTIDTEELSDDAVFSLIQLVANAVENLQPENVSVIDTVGKVISAGVLQRIAERELLGSSELEEEMNQDGPGQNESTALPNPIIPDFEEIGEWISVKKDFESELEDKVIRQLMGVIPLGSYKVSAISEIGSLTDGKGVDIQRLSISVVIDNARDDIYLDETLREEIFSTIAGAISYQSGRDVIQISQADFTLLTEEERQELSKFERKRKLTPSDYIFIGFVILLSLTFILGIYKYVRAWLNNRKNETESLKVIADSEDRSLDEIHEEMTLDRKVDRVRIIGTDTPRIVGSILENWLDSLLENEANSPQSQTNYQEEVQTQSEEISNNEPYITEDHEEYSDTYADEEDSDRTYDNTEEDYVDREEDKQA